jgi:hypothetical protein
MDTVTITKRLILAGAMAFGVYTYASAQDTGGFHSQGFGPGTTSVQAGLQATRAYAEMYFDNETPNQVTVVSADTYYAMTTAGDGGTISPLTVGTQDAYSGATASGITGKITAGTLGAGTYLVHATVSANGPNNAKVHFAIRKNSTVQAQTRSGVLMPGTTHRSVFTAKGLVTLAAGDTVDLVVTSDHNSDVVDIYHVNLTAVRISM